MQRLIKVLCVDDNELIAEAIRRRLRREPDFVWLGWLPRSSDLTRTVIEQGPDIVVLDVDIPGDDTFQTIRDMARDFPLVRVLILSGHSRREYIDKAIAAGAWGYVVKSEETDSIIDAMRRVVQGEFILPEDLAADPARG